MTTTYIVGYYTQDGRRTQQVQATSREEARTTLLAQGYIVTDVSIN
jgi:hypothetical protein